MGKGWIVMQNTRHGERYFRGGYPELLDSWSPDIRKAARFDWEQVVNIRDHCQAHTFGDDCKRVKVSP